MIKIFISLCALTFYVTEVELVSSDYNYYQQAEGWLKLNPTPANWTAARLHCFKEGAVLASPENERFWSAMKTLLINSQTLVKRGIFTGIHVTYSAYKGDYYSIEGTPLSRMPVVWAPGEPDNADSSEECLLMQPNGALADVKCSDAYPYVCYRRENPTAVTDCGTADSGYYLDHRTDKCYKFHLNFKDWANAFAACSREGAHLAIINSETEAQVLKELFAINYLKNNDSAMEVAHIGHREWEEHGLWMTVHGETLKEAGYNNWHYTDEPLRHEPNHVKGAECKTTRCGAIYRDALLDDVVCSLKRPFICEKKGQFTKQC